MDLESIKRLLEGEGEEHESPAVVDSMPLRFIEPLISHGLKIQIVQPDRLLCSFKVPPRIVEHSNGSLHDGVIAALVDVIGAAAVFVGGAPATGVSVDINVSYVGAAYAGVRVSIYLQSADSVIHHKKDEIEIDAKVLGIKNAIAVVSVELRNTKTGKVIAQGRHSKYWGFQQLKSKI
ncbi:unnamed protein product [Cuscuta epithymum]|uniref:Thioesterase domain-containing protein n=1 Tax=Cuscuta epithymum TaxID=186058 RepID=A0AAV0C118_9ASTE|nr:unnamed protein product [Cuscuta epithymum]